MQRRDAERKGSCEHREMAARLSRLSRFHWLVIERMQKLDFKHEFKRCQPLGLARRLIGLMEGGVYASPNFNRGHLLY